MPTSLPFFFERNVNFFPPIRLYWWSTLGLQSLVLEATARTCVPVWRLTTRSAETYASQFRTCPTTTRVATQLRSTCGRSFLVSDHLVSLRPICTFMISSMHWFMFSTLIFPNTKSKTPVKTLAPYNFSCHGRTGRCPHLRSQLHIRSFRLSFCCRPKILVPPSSSLYVWGR